MSRNRIRFVIAVATGLSVFASACKSAPEPPPTSQEGQVAIAYLEKCIDFEDLSVGIQLPNPFTTEGNIIPFTGGSVTPDDQHNADNSTPTEIFLYDSRIFLDFAREYPGVTFNYGDLGGTVHLSVNGHVWDGEDMTQGPATFGAVKATYQTSSSDARKGRVTLEGHVETLWVGGQELALDYFCPLDEDE